MTQKRQSRKRHRSRRARSPVTCVYVTSHKDVHINYLKDKANNNKITFSNGDITNYLIQFEL